ncbi:MAG: 30S ribosomal protein S4 [Candidatus Micrarchaeales archaeon]|jgi:ribosomal protein S4(archaeal type)/S9(eukaryote cytosolic type)|uniref:Small ribosomal subunit protein uS4 n=1 Tax=Candidatus Micrarchaeum acidiphilum ARMAN-2 TaxID=425595 RepID=A0SNY6_MICA2|nr:ribosomal protein small subunit S9 [Candidatus Micrarchaeum acidiphilum ARMAN-2]EET90213.1 MAG: ribosomal protein S4 [Candidatus Micrarchaeum acidiphilum ARMAN-2]MCW6160782.1 30S ribosomal protein S4 [Candidatus Micrarchaeales archaeon]
MGAPKRNRRKYDKPKDIWNLARIKADNALIAEYGLANMHELWKVQSEISRLRGNVRVLLSGSSSHDTSDKIIARMVKFGILENGATLEKVLDITPNAFLERRLQTVVFKKGLARTIKQARQLITHGFIAVNMKRVSIPGYMVTTAEDDKISYYKPIDINVNVKQPEAAKPESAEQEKAQPAEEAVAQ